MRTECLAFGGPIRYGAGNARLALGIRGCGPKRFAEGSQTILAGDKTLAIVPEMTQNFPAELHIDPGPHTLFEGVFMFCAAKPKGVLKGE